MTLFSIITVTRNNREGLKKTALSIGEQDYRDFQWIIIDAVSSDGTHNDLEEYGADILCEPDNGPYDGMNKGIDLALGDYLIFMNAGDGFAESQTLGKTAAAIVQENPDFLYGDSWESDGQRRYYKPARTFKRACLGMFTHHQAMYYKRSVIAELRYDLSYRIAADYDFTLGFLDKAKKTACLRIPICDFRSGGLSQTNVRSGRNEQFLVRARRKIVPLPANITIYLLQALSWKARKIAPNLFWRLKNRAAIF